MHLLSERKAEDATSADGRGMAAMRRTPTLMTPVLASALLSALLAVGGCRGFEEALDHARTGAQGWQLVATPQSSGTDALLQAISPVDERVVWASGHQGTWLRTLDGGETWSAHVLAQPDTLQFRDVAAFDAENAVLMSAGPGALSRIYRTSDAGETWTLRYVADHPAAFLDCLDFWDSERGIAYGDAVDGVPFVLATEDGGRSWSRVPAEGLPKALEGEGGFAASGTCVETGPPGTAWIGTGNGDRARLLITEDWGASWTAVDVPVVGGPAAGLTSVHMGGNGLGVGFGGIIGTDSVWTANVAVTRQGGRTWTRTSQLAMPGPAYGGALVETDHQTVFVAVGPRGMDWSLDRGRSWEHADSLAYWAVAFAGPGAGWAVGPNGRITHLYLQSTAGSD